MSSTLISNINSTAQYQANLLTNTPNLVQVMVEDEADVVVWYRILSRYAPGYRFDIHPYSFIPSQAGKGKANVLAFAGSFGQYYIGCVDSDYDWVLDTPAGAVIKESPFIFQTYAYAIENLAAQPVGITDCLIECYMHSCELAHNMDADYRNFIGALSDRIYDVLLWHLVMRKCGIDIGQIPVGLKHIFGNEHYSDIHKDSDLSIEARRAEVLNRFSERAEQLTGKYEKVYGYLQSERQGLEDELRSRYGLTRENAYLYVRGHDLHDFIKCNLFNPVCQHLRREHIEKIHSNANRNGSVKGSDVGDVIKHYNKLVKEFEIKYLHRQAYLEESVNPLLYQRIKADIEAVYQG